MKSDISLFRLRSNLFPKLSLVIAVGLRRALGLIEVLAVGFWVVVVATVVVVVVVDVVVVDVVVEVVVDCASGILIGKLKRGYWVEYFSSGRDQGVVDFCVDTE